MQKKSSAPKPSGNKPFGMPPKGPVTPGKGGLLPKSEVPPRRVPMKKPKGG